MKPLIFIGDLTPYQETISGCRRRQYARLLSQANRYEQMDLPAVHPKESTTYMGIAIVNLALAYRLSGEKRYLDEAKRFISTVLSYEKWGNAHLVNVDLSASWILFGLSLGYDWLKNDLSTLEKKRILQKIYHHAKIIFDYRRDTYGHGWSTNFYQNHNWINMTGLAAAGYALKDETEDAGVFIQEAKDNFARVFDLLAEDGSNYEGVTYWRYGGMWLFVYAHLLKVQEGIDYFQTCPYLKNTFYYRLYQGTGNLKQQLNFGDCHDRYSSHAACVYYKAAAEYRDGHAQKLGNMVVDRFLMEEAQNSHVKPGILPEAAFEFLWYDPDVMEQDFSDLPLTRFFPDLGLLTVRSNWEPNAKVMSIKCSPPGGAKQWEKGWDILRNENIHLFSLSHHHPDNLSYIFVSGSEYFTCEDGYNRNLMPDNHNVLLVDGAYTDVENENDVYLESVKKHMDIEKAGFQSQNYSGHVCSMQIIDTLVLYRGETSGVYPSALKMREVSRTLITDGLKFWVFVDVFSSDVPHIYSILCNTDLKAKTAEQGFLYGLRSSEINYQVFSSGPFSQRQYTQEVTSVMTTQEPDKVTRTSIQTLRTDSAKAHTAQVFYECFTFVNSSVKVRAEEQALTVECDEKTYRIESSEWDADNERTPIKVFVNDRKSEQRVYDM